MRVAPSICLLAPAHNFEAFLWALASMGSYNQQHRNSDIRFVTPHQRYCGKNDEICIQTEVVWIKPPLPDKESESATLVIAA